MSIGYLQETYITGGVSSQEALSQAIGLDIWGEKSPKSGSHSLLAVCKKALKPDVLQALERQLGLPLHRETVATEITEQWLHRLLLMRQLEDQVVQWHGGDEAYRFLGKKQMSDWETLQQVCSEVLLRPSEVRNTADFSLTPALPIPLFRPSVFEHNRLNISALPFPQKSEKQALLPIILQGLRKINTPFAQTPTPHGPPQDLATSFVKKALSFWLREKLSFTCDIEALPKELKAVSGALIQQSLDGLKVCDPVAEEGALLHGAMLALLGAKHEWAAFGKKTTPALKRIRLRGGSLHTAKGEAFPYAATAGPGGYNRQVEKQVQQVYEAFFAQGAQIVDRQLFGVSSTASALAHSRLKLWSALLGLAHYTTDSGLEELSDLPDLTHHLCHGNALKSRFNLDTSLAKMLKGNKLRLGVYRSAIRMYQNSTSPDTQAEARGIFTDMQKNFRMELRRNLPVYQRLKRLEAAQNLEENPLFDFAQTPEDQGKKMVEAARLQAKIARLRLQVAGAVKSDQSFEWRYQFPEVLAPEDGSFEGFDMLVTCPPEAEATGEERRRCADFVELCIRLTKPQTGLLALMLPDDFFRNKAYRSAVKSLEAQTHIHEMEAVDGESFGPMVTGKVMVWATKH